MQGTILSSRQAAFLLFMTLAGNALVLAPATGAGSSAWLSNLLGALVGLYILVAIISIQKAFPGQSIVKVSELCLGKLLGKILSLIYIIVLLYATIVYLFDACIIIRTILPFITCYILRPLMVLAAAYCIYKGVNAVGRLAEVLVPLSLLLITISFLLMLTVADFSRLEPVLADWKAILAGTIDGAGWPYSGISILALFLPFVNDMAKKKYLIYVWYLVGVLVVALRSLLIMAVLGPDMTILLRFPLYASLRMLALADFQRIELFFFILWFISGFTVLMINYLSASLALKDFIGLPRLNPLVLPLGFFVTVMSLYMYSSDMEFYTLGSVTTPIIILTVNILYTTIIWLGIKMRARSLTGTQPKPDRATVSSGK